MKKIKQRVVIGLLVAGSQCAGIAIAEEKSVKADNTKRNSDAYATGTVNAEKQGNSSEDVTTTAKIRSAIVDNAKLSTYAHNVKIITNNGHVTLMGPVRSEAERTAVENAAQSVVPKERLSNRLTIATDNKM